MLHEMGVVGMQESGMLVGYIERAVDEVSYKGGTDGEGSFSPTATVTKTDGITTITVTDKNGTTSAQVLDGKPGEAGARGEQGIGGADGFSPSVTVSKTDGVTTITATDKNGTTSAQVLDGSKGERGEKGADGFSPTVTVNKVGDATTVTVTDRNGTTTAQILNGKPGDKGDPGERGEKGDPGGRGDPGPAGAKGADGFSPTVAVNKVGGITTVTVTDKDGTTSAQILDGAKGEKGDTADLTRIEADIETVETQQTEQAAAISATAEGVALNRSTLGYQRKNLLKVTATTQTIKGITFTVNADGSINVNGTADSQVSLFLNDMPSDLQGKRLTLTGCPSGGNYQTGYSLFGVKISNSHTFIKDIGLGDTVVAPNEPCRFSLLLRKNTTVSNLTFYPMLRYAEITDDTYEPYKPSVQEQIDALIDRIAALESSQTDFDS